MRLIKNSGYTLASSVLGGLFFFFVNALVARHLGAEGFGAYTFVLAFLSFFFMLANIGMDSVIVRELARNWNAKDSIIGGAVMLRTLFSLAAMILSVALIRVLNYSEFIQYGVLLVALTLLTNSLVSLWWSVFQARFEMKWYALTNLSGRAGILALTIFFILQKQGVLWLLAVHTLAGIVQLIIVWVLAAKRITFTLKFDKERILFLLRESWPLALAGLFISLYYRVDVFMLSFWRPQQDIGYYAAVYTITEAPAMISVALNASLYPLLSQLHTVKNKFQQYSAWSVKAMMVLALPMAIGTTILAQPVINVVYGQAYTASVPVLQVLIWAGGIIMTNVIIASMLNALGAQKITTTATGFNLMLNAALNLYAIPRYGIMGAAATTVATELVCGLMMWYALYKKNYQIIHYSWLRCVFAAILMGAVVYTIKSLQLPIVIIVGMLSYAIFLFLLKGITAADINIFHRIWRMK
ncbi:MAG: flippase [Candidatus Aenigmarchaeota archaeon]|nr:flippase [Candidatus Aenigmarchaeota archaeon]